MASDKKDVRCSFCGRMQDEVKRLIGVSPQETAVAPNLSVKENLELICGIHSFSKEKTKKRIHELFAKCDAYMEGISVADDKKAALKDFANTILNRNL